MSGKHIAIAGTAAGVIVAAAAVVLVLRGCTTEIVSEDRAFLERSWPTYRSVLAHVMTCKTVPPVREESGLLQGYCYREGAGTHIDIAAYGEGPRALTRVRAHVEGALGSAELETWRTSFASAVTQEKVQRKLVAWLIEHVPEGGAHARFAGQSVSVAVAPNLVEATITSSEDATPPSGAAFKEVALEALARRFAPVLHFAHDERFFPLRIDQYLAQSQLCRFRLVGRKRAERGECAKVPRSGDPVPGLHCLKEGGQCVLSLDIIGAEEDRDPTDHLAADKRMRMDSPTKSVYWHAVKPSPTRLLLEYWLFYSFNDFRNNKHEGDWEGITVEVRPGAGGLPAATRVALSSHRRSQHRMVQTPEAEFVGQWRPAVYVAPASHANYFAPGPKPVKQLCSNPPVEVCITPQDRPDARGRTLLPPPPPGALAKSCHYALRPLSGNAPAWIYGANNLIFIPPAPAFRSGTGPSDPRSRDVWDSLPLNAFEGESSGKARELEPSDLVCEGEPP